MGKYKELLGIGKVTIGGQDFQVQPDMLDCEAFSKIRKEVGKGDEVAALKKNCDLLHHMILKQENHDDEDKKELHNFLYLHQKECIEETQILFKWTTKEERDEQKELIKKALSDGDIVKKLME